VLFHRVPDFDLVPSPAEMHSDRGFEGAMSDISILVIDDSPATHRIVSDLSSVHGFTSIQTVPDTLAAFQIIRKDCVDLVICEVETQPLNGLELLKAMREEAATRDVIFVLMSANRDPTHVLTARKLNADAFLLKPFTADSLRTKLSRIARLQSLVKKK
jgi:two-component system, chemotaxis family, chemotaxis protein CheY